MKRFTLAALFLLALLALPAAGQDTCPPLEIGDADAMLAHYACVAEQQAPLPAAAESEPFSMRASAASTALKPGVGLIMRSSDRIVTSSKRPPGCPRQWKLNPARSPWKVLGLDPYSWVSSRVRTPDGGSAENPAYEEFFHLYNEFIGGGFWSTTSLRSNGKPMPCWAGGFAGGDPHLVTGGSILPILCAAGPIPGVLEGAPSTHNCRPREDELMALQSAATYDDRVSPAYVALEKSSRPPPGPTPPVEQCSKGWTCEPMPSPDYPERRRAEGWKVLALNPANRAPLDCYQETKGFGLTLYHVESPRCRGEAVTPPPPPPPPPVCGDARCEGGEAVTCPRDCPVVEPPPPEDCTAARDLFGAALETLLACERGRTP